MKYRIGSQSFYAYDAGKGIDAARSTLVFLHGAGMDHTVWTLCARHFARHGRNVLALDLPGHGRSDGPALHSIEVVADWVVASLDALGIASASVVGHSMGSLVALDAAARHGERVSRVALVGTAVPMPVADAILQDAAADSHDAFDMLTLWGYSRRHQYGGNSNPGFWFTNATLRLFERSAPGVLHADLGACNGYASGLERAAQVACPALLVLGQEDRLTPVRGSKPLQSALKTAQVRVIPGSGHTLMSEAPNELLDALRGFLL
jgi:pimeloyl-ACP methyl ester carboxylesterase